MSYHPYYMPPAWERHVPPPIMPSYLSREWQFVDYSPLTVVNPRASSPVHTPVPVAATSTPIVNPDELYNVAHIMCSLDSSSADEMPASPPRVKHVIKRPRQLLKTRRRRNVPSRKSSACGHTIPTTGPNRYWCRTCQERVDRGIDHTTTHEYDQIAHQARKEALDELYM